MLLLCSMHCEKICPALFKTGRRLCCMQQRPWPVRVNVVSVGRPAVAGCLNTVPSHCHFEITQQHAVDGSPCMSLYPYTITQRGNCGLRDGGRGSLQHWSPSPSAPVTAHSRKLAVWLLTQITFCFLYLTADKFNKVCGSSPSCLGKNKGVKTASCNPFHCMFVLCFFQCVF